MDFYFNLIITYVLIGVFFSSLFFFFIFKSNTVIYPFYLLFGILGSFLGVFFNAIISFDPLKYIYFFREVFTISIFWPSIFSFLVLLFFCRNFTGRRKDNNS